MSGLLTLTSTVKTEYTLVSNDFIDHYMPQANGSYVKVYLYLLRLLNSGSSNITLTMIADCLDETEKDIERALKYWEKQKLMQLTRDSALAITEISLLEPAIPAKVPTASAVPAPQQETSPAGTPPFSSAPAECSAALQPPEKTSGRRLRFEKPNYSAAQVAELAALPDVQRIGARLEQILGRLLKTTDEQFILYLYESVGFSADLIIYLYEYCVSQNKKNSSYIEAVALSWAEEGIDTVEKAEASSAAYNSSYNAVNRAFGLNRAPGNIEKQYMQRWFTTYGFDVPIIEEACNRTMLAVSKPDFKYADKILENWHRAGVTRKEDIAVLDSEFARKNAAKEVKRQSQEPASGASLNNRFNAFPQRKYTASDYSSMEEKLLNSK